MYRTLKQHCISRHFVFRYSYTGTFFSEQVFISFSIFVLFMVEPKMFPFYPTTSSFSFPTNKTFVHSTNFHFIFSNGFLFVTPNHLKLFSHLMVSYMYSPMAFSLPHQIISNFSPTSFSPKKSFFLSVFTPTFAAFRFQLCSRPETEFTKVDWMKVPDFCQLAFYSRGFLQNSDFPDP